MCIHTQVTTIKGKEAVSLEETKKEGRWEDPEGAEGGGNM